MRKDIYIAPNPNFTGEFDVLSNGASSGYNALQAQYRRRCPVVFTILSYTWAHFN